MNMEAWRRAYEPAPAGFHCAVQAALKMKEEKMVKKAIPRTIVIAFALCVLLLGTALAVGAGLLDFLYVHDTGNVQVIAPEIMRKTGEKVHVDVREAACDGITAHVVVAFKLEGTKLVRDTYAEILSEMDRANTMLFQENYEITVNGEAVYSYGFNYRYEGEDTVVADYLIDLRKLNQEMPETLLISLGMRVMDFDYNTLEKCDVEVKVPVQCVSRQVYTATNLPCEQDNYRLLSAQVVRTDIGCYLTIEAEDIATAEEMEPYVESYVTMINRYPVQGSFGVNALDENGNAYQVLYAQRRALNESDVETVVHLRCETICQRFDVGDMLTIQPFVNDARFKGQLLPITLRLQPE